MRRERRRHARYHRADIVLNVARRGIKGILRVTPFSECLDFGIAGLQFGSTQHFQEGERLVLDFRIQELEVREIIAQVVSCQAKGDGMFHTNVRFCFELKRMQRPAISHMLLRIEDRLRTAQQFPA